MSEFWLIVTLCVVPTIGDAIYDSGQSVLSSECAEYRVENSFSSIQECRLHQMKLSNIPLEGRRMMAFLCSAKLDSDRLGDLPLLSVVLGDRA